MKFGRIPVADAEGSLLAHTLKLDNLRLKKGHRITEKDIAALQEHDCKTIVAAQLEANDINENQAATRVAAAIGGQYISAQAAFTGRTNLYADTRGLLVYDRTRLDQLNMVDEAVTVAALSPFTLVEPRQFIATVKIIPYGVASTTVGRTANIAESPEPLFRIATFKPVDVGLIQTRLPGIRDSVLNKTRLTLETRLERLDCQLTIERRCNHDEIAIAEALKELQSQGCKLFLIIGASATADRRDVIPSGIESMGGQILHLGMPVEPGNLLLLAQLDADCPVIGLPGCARSPALNGVDWVIERLLAGLNVSGKEIMCMGAGGFIKGSTKILTTRAHAIEAVAEHDEASHTPKITAIILAAGMSRRMGKVNKLLEPVNNEMMVTKVTRQVLASQVDSVLLVAGHEEDKVRSAVRDKNIKIVTNPDFAKGLSTSLHCGLTYLADDVDAAIICLADMPSVSTSVIDQLIAAFSPEENRLICVPVYQGQRGNPVVLAKRFFSEMNELSGDKGAREFLQKYVDLVCEVEIEDPSILHDIDEPESLLKYKAANN
ncbi:MAG: NTP transferase domain-containing protein [Gammaproteobacteria bacterium]|jgi:molybdenum cofactor cytidylyltransferase|nr:NTP transferase domain-containing protein [Gammaproteobacteria bacterium]